MNEISLRNPYLAAPMKPIELLAPAKNLETGRAAINYGADAVYIGADRFGARAAAANSIADIENLVTFAHQYRAKVFVTLNTILFDHELEDAAQMIRQLYGAGVDALIIQDMGILEMDLPPIALHASTQTNNFDSQRIGFLDSMGFQRIVLARELSLDEIRSIRSQTRAELEYFVHGSLCVSLSGQCYFSQTITGRSANRGQCAQMCRHPYALLDGQGNPLALDSHFLSLKDLNLGDHLHDLLQAGITSFKIEGRLKDLNYVKNVVSYYRSRLDAILGSDSGFSRASSGRTAISFEPDPERSFSRGSTDYFLYGRERQLINRASPKSMGKWIGIVDSVGHETMTLRSGTALHNGDGLCFIRGSELLGVRVEKVMGDQVLVSSSEDLSPGMELYRNYDHEFNKSLETDKAIRKVDATIQVQEEGDQLRFMLIDEDRLTSTLSISPLPQAAKIGDLASRNLVTQLSRSGSSMFQIRDVILRMKTAYFFPISQLNGLRRQLFEMHQQLRIESFAGQDVQRMEQSVEFPGRTVDFAENIANHKAEQFYRRHGVTRLEPALEISAPKPDQLLMTTRYCLKYEMGWCERFQDVVEKPIEPLFLEDRNRRYQLQFDCRQCLMHIRLQPDPLPQ